MMVNVRSQHQAAFLLGYLMESVRYAHQEGCKAFPDPDAHWGISNPRELLTEALHDLMSLLVHLNVRFPNQVEHFLRSAETVHDRLQKGWIRWHGSHEHEELLARVRDEHLPCETAQLSRERLLPYPRLFGALLFEYSPPEIARELNSLEQLTSRVAERLEPHGREYYVCGAVLRDVEVSILPQTGDATDAWRHEEAKDAASRCRLLAPDVQVPALSTSAFRKERGTGKTDHSEYYLWIADQLQTLYEAMVYDLGSMVTEPEAREDAGVPAVDDTTAVLGEMQVLGITGGIERLRFLEKNRKCNGHIEITEMGRAPLTSPFRKQHHLLLCFLADRMRSVTVEGHKVLGENHGFVRRSEIVEYLTGYGEYAGNIKKQVSKFVTEINRQVPSAGKGIFIRLISSCKVPLLSDPTAPTTKSAKLEPACRLNVLPRFISDIPELK